MIDVPDSPATEQPATEHRLEGLEPDNLLAFLALLGLLRALEEAVPALRPRARWNLERPPLRPVLVLREPHTRAEVAEAAAAGCEVLAAGYDFMGHADLTFQRGDARNLLEEAGTAGGSRAEIAAALASDAAVKDDGRIEATPLCLLFGQGHQHFLDRLASVPRTARPPKRGRGRAAVELTPAECLTEALFGPWERLDDTFSFRWDPHEDVRYALRFNDPSDSKTKERTQHGANRLAAIGLAALTVAPATRGGRVRLACRGVKAGRAGVFFAWPIWREPASLTAIEALLADPRLVPEPEPRPGDRRRSAAREDLAYLGVAEVRRARRISQGKFMNWTRAEPVSPETPPEEDARRG